MLGWTDSTHAVIGGESSTNPGSDVADLVTVGSTLTCSSLIPPQRSGSADSTRGCAASTRRATCRPARGPGCEADGHAAQRPVSPAALAEDDTDAEPSWCDPFAPPDEADDTVDTDTSRPEPVARALGRLSRVPEPADSGGPAPPPAARTCPQPGESEPGAASEASAGDLLGAIHAARQQLAAAARPDGGCCGEFASNG